MFSLTKQITRMNPIITPLMEWKNGLLYSRQSKPAGKGGFEKVNVPITKWFGVDIWQLQSGWYWWHESKRYTLLVPLGEPEPDQPNEAAIECYSVPVYSAELSGRADFIIENAGAFTGFQALLEEINGCAEVKQGMIPQVLHVGTVESDDGPIPALAITKWAERPSRWGERLIACP